MVPDMKEALVRTLGVNDRCWCGSGLKYKKCHRDRDADAARSGDPVPERVAKPVRPGVVSPRRSVPPHIAAPDYAISGKPSRVQMPEVKDAGRIERMRRACRAAAHVLKHTASYVRPGITGDELDEIAHEECIRLGGYPSPLNYQGFPKSLCVSVNEVICHGIPDSRALEDGDIVNLDVTIYLDGMHGDTNATFLVGEVDPESRRLVDVTRRCLELGIAAVKPGAHIYEIGRAIETHARQNNCSVVRDYCGHGIGELFHTSLHIAHHYDPRNDTVLVPGMTFTIEPMINLGSWRATLWPDGWTAVTTDGKRSAQFEHTVLVTPDGVEVLTVTGGPAA
jgi:methionyl aminopeptidase